MRYVTRAKVLEQYRVLVRFDDGVERIVDLEGELAGEVFEPLRDLEFFKEVRVDSDLDTLVWANGADFAPDFLFAIGEVLDGKDRAPLVEEG